MAVETSTIQAFRNRYLGQVATRCFVPTTLTTANKQQMSRTGHFAREHISKLKLVLPNFYVNSSGVESGTGNTATFTASVEYPAGVFYQATFNNATSVSANSASIVTTDYINVNIPKGKQFWVKVWRADQGGILYNSPGTSLKSNVLHGDAFNFSTTTVPDTTMSNTATNLDATNLYEPMAIVGPTKSGSVAILGDSIAFGQNDTVDANGDVGVFRYIGPTKGYINLARPSDRAQWFVGNSALRRSMIQYCTDVIIQHGINDLGSGNRSNTELETDLTTIGTLIKTDYPNKRLWVATNIPQTNSNLNIATATTNTYRTLVNTWKRKIPSPYDGCIDLADGIESGRNTGLYASNTYINTDGTHPNQNGYIAIQQSGHVDASSFDF